MRSCGFAIVLLVAVVTESFAHAQIDDPPSAQSTPDEAELARSARLETILRVALERNPDLAEGQSRAEAAAARAQAVSRLPDLELKYEQWGVPLSRPYALDQAQTLMLGLRQTLPPWGTLAARGQAAAEETAGARASARGRRQDLVAQVRRTFAVYYRASRELQLHLEHVGLTSRVVELARFNQRTGHGTLADVLRLEVELTRLHTDLARLERDERSSRALLNALMARLPEAALGPPEELVVVPSIDVTVWERSLDANRPDIDGATRAVRRSEALLDETRRAARFPSLMVGIDYWYMPTIADRNGYGAMVGINLPWLSGRHGDEERAAELVVQAERHALASTRNAAHYELHDAAARVDSARQSFTLIDQELLGQSRRSVEAMQAAYAAGQGDVAAVLDALRSYLQVRVERVAALAELAVGEADLERAAGMLAAGEAR